MKVWCKCKRLKKDFSCLVVRTGEAVVKCDDVCQEKKKERVLAQEAELSRKKKEEEIKNQREVEKFERKFKPRRKCKDKSNDEPTVEESRYNYVVWILAVLVIVVAGLVTFFNYKM